MDAEEIKRQCARRCFSNAKDELRALRRETMEKSEQELQRPPAQS